MRHASSNATLKKRHANYNYHAILLSLMNDIEQVRVMTALRHPNVVLFMAACTKPPKMCIVMEFMSLGSLYDVLITIF
jgi:serine/threonine protein kinase